MTYRWQIAVSCYLFGLCCGFLLGRLWMIAVLR